MNLVLIVSRNGLENEKIIQTRIGRRKLSDSEPLLLDENISWYAELSSGDSSFRRINSTSTVGSELNKNAKWVREVWEQGSYAIRFYVINEDEAERLIATHPYQDDEELDD